MKQKAPAKVNLMLAVHGRREDGFHELTSLVAAVDFGDDLELRCNYREADRLFCEGIEVPLDDSNLVMQAARRWREATGRRECFDFRLTKRVPVGAGLGGGSSDGVAALKGMNQLIGPPLEADELRVIASALGSDCTFFVDSIPSVMRGRGERIETLDASIRRRLSGQRIALFRPDFGIETAWAYGQLVRRPHLYEAVAVGQRRLEDFMGGGPLSGLLHNSFEPAVGAKYLAIPCLLEMLRLQGYACVMSGSGSACLALVTDDDQMKALKELCLSCWGEHIFWVETSICSAEYNA